MNDRIPPNSPQGTDAAFERERYEYMNESVGFWRSLWLVLRGSRVREYVTYLVVEPDEDGPSIWTKVKSC